MSDIEWTTARVVHCNTTLWQRVGYTWHAIGCHGSVSPLSALPNRLTGPVTVVIDHDGCITCDLDSLTTPDNNVRALLRGAGYV